MSRANILIVDDDPDFSSILKTTLESRGYAAEVCMDGAECERSLARSRPDLIILDMMMGGRMEGALLARRLKRPDGAAQSIPIMILTGVRQQTGFFWLEDPRDPVHLPVEEILEKPLRPAELVQKVERVLARRAGKPAGRQRTVLLIDDNPAMRAACVEVLARTPEYAVAVAQDGLAGLEMVRRCDPDIVLVDLQLPGMDGAEVMRRVQKEFPGMPVIGITGDGLAVSAVERTLAQRVRWLLKPFTPAELRDAVRQSLETAAASGSPT